MMETDGGYIDLQVNGYGGIDFNQDDLSAGQLNECCVRLEKDGVAKILATIITDKIEVMEKRIARLAGLRKSDPLARRMIAGLHIEGPFLNENAGYRGAHAVDAIRPADTENMRRLIDAGDGLVRLVTLAPERDAGMKVVSSLVRENIHVSAGHTDASLDQLKAAVDAGLSLFTHLGNGCPMQMHRHDNIIQRVLSLGGLITPCFIADGVHVPFFTLGNYLRAVGIDRCIVVTDAMAAAGMGPGRYKIGRWTMDVGEDLAAWAPDRSHLVGSAGTMMRSETNLRDRLGLSKQQCDTLLKLNPGKMLGAK